MKKKALLLTTVVMLVILLLAGFKNFKVRKETQAMSMEQIYRKEGVPVKVEEVQPKDFTATLNYSATLRARSEAVRYSRVSDVVQQVLFKVGDYVRENQTVITFPKNNQTTQYYQIKAGYDLAESTYRRMNQLYNEGVISKQELDTARANYEVAKANLNVTDDSLRVKAPISGYITQLNVKPTDYVAKDQPLFTVSNLDLIEAQLWASSDEVDQIKLGRKVTLSWEGKQFEGTVSQIGQIMDINKKAFEVKALFKNKNKILTSGITADIAVETYRNSQAVLVRRSDLVTENGQQFVYVVENGLAIKREVEIGAEQGTLVEIKSGLVPGDRVITDGNKMVSDRAKVKIVKS